MRPSVRFDVFKRDAFSCAYCGRRPPEVTLEVDHIIPRIEGGSDDPENLTTSCWDCNRGKGANPLDVDPVALPDLQERAGIVRERERQLRAYNAAKEEERNRREDAFTEAWAYWFTVWDEEELPRYHLPWDGTLRRYVDSLGTSEVLDAMDITRGRFNYITSNAVKYFVGVLKRKQADLEGRLKTCTRCGKFLVLETDQDATLDYHHSGCADA